MEEKKTVQYKRTLRGSVGAGMSALMGGSGRRYYILEHRDASKYHKAGESQKIIIDQIELGRGHDCQVRFDETFETVSRRHAAIIRDGDRWKLVQLSTTNTTFLNGRAIDTEWYLQNGDEIQLAVGGPRLGFIVPEGNQSLVKSIKMTERLELFRKQALAPYKRAIVALSILLVLAIAGLTTWNVLQKKNFDQQIAEARETLTKIKGKNAELDSLLEAAKKEQARQDSLIKVIDKRKSQVRQQVRIVDRSNEVSKLLSKVESDVYFMIATVYVTNGSEKQEVPNYGWVGTGFLTTDGKFITAKHCVEGWKYKLPTDNDEALALLYLATNMPGCKIVADITAVSKNRRLHFTSEQFIMDHSAEKKHYVDGENYIVEASAGHTDWAYVNTSEKGSIVIDRELATQLPIGADLHLLGFPLGMGAVDTPSLSPLYGSCKTSQAGLENGIIRISARNYESGNSGGPVFYMQNGRLKAIGIVSYSVSTTTHGGITSISNIR